jgi:hypothetical protein
MNGDGPQDRPRNVREAQARARHVCSKCGGWLQWHDVWKWYTCPRCD